MLSMYQTLYKNLMGMLHLMLIQPSFLSSIITFIIYEMGKSVWAYVYRFTSCSHVSARVGSSPIPCHQVEQQPPSRTFRAS